jgi:hypothetical protein
MKLIFTSMAALGIVLAAANLASGKGPKGGKKGGPWHTGHFSTQPMGAGEAASGQIYRHGNRYYYVPNHATSPAPGTSEGQTYRLLRHGNRYQWVPADQYPEFVPPGQTFVPPGHWGRVPPPPPGTVVTGPGMAGPPVQNPTPVPSLGPTPLGPVPNPTPAHADHHH